MAWKRATWIALALLTAGCLGKADTKAVDDARAQFYQRVAAQQYGAIWDDSAPQIQGSVKRDPFIAMMQDIDTKLGACKPPVKAFDFKTNVTTEGTLSTQGYTRVCANGTLTEEVTVLLAGGKAKIAGYDYKT